MRAKINIFTKIIFLIVLLLMPIIILYAYSNKASIDVVQKEIQQSNLNKLSFFRSQMDETIDQLSIFAIFVSKEPMIRQYLDRYQKIRSFEQVEMQNAIVAKLNLLSVSSKWSNKLIVYFPNQQEAISSDYSGVFDEAYLLKNRTQIWQYQKKTNGSTGEFVKHTLPESEYSNPEQAEVIIEVRFSEDNIKNMLNQFKAEGERNLFLYHPNEAPIVNPSADGNLVNQLTAYLDNHNTINTESRIIKLGNQKYLVNVVESASLRWSLVEYIPIQEILKPITTSRRLFYISIGLLLATSVFAAFLLYRHVQNPIKQLMSGVQMLKMGLYSTRLNRKTNNEFEFLFIRFNEMAEQIQKLIEKVYMEKIRSREAMLKQLQSQINPHFLYNSLFYIKNMARLGEEEAVVAMALNLGEYYRYTTRVETPLTSLKEEIHLVTNYMNIQNMRMKRFHFKIDIPEEMMDMKLPRLLLQPIVENAAIHGTEPNVGEGFIYIKGEQDEIENRIIVEDNGVGMSKHSLDELKLQLLQNLDDQMGCGVWNVNQRLLLHFGEGAGLLFFHSDSGGLKVVLKWGRNDYTSNIDF